jgi:hypothetical protein
MSDLYFKFNSTFFLGSGDSAEFKKMHQFLLQQSSPVSASSADSGNELNEEVLEEDLANAANSRIAIDYPYSSSPKGEGLLFVLRIFQEVEVVGNEEQSNRSAAHSKELPLMEHCCANYSH